MPHLISAESQLMSESRAEGGAIWHGWLGDWANIGNRQSGGRAMPSVRQLGGGHRRKPDREDAPADGAGRHHDWGATDGMTCTFPPSGGNGGNGDPQSTLKARVRR